MNTKTYIEWSGDDREMCAKMSPRKETDEFLNGCTWTAVGQGSGEPFFPNIRYRRFVEGYNWPTWNSDTDRLDYIEKHGLKNVEWHGSGEDLRRALDRAMTSESAFEKWFQENELTYEGYFSKATLQRAFEAGAFDESS